MKTPITDFLNEYAASGMSRFHMPGHKGQALDSERFDITEVNGADSLYEADGIIAESEANAAELFGTAATFYSVEGSSQCIRAMLALVTKWEDPAPSDITYRPARPVILAARNVHRSFLTAAALLDLDVDWLYPENDDFTLCSCPVSAEQVRNKLAEMPAAPCAVYLTSPDYLGGMQDIQGVADAAHEAGIPLIVDNAHGAYLAFLEPSLHPIALGADICCDSAHKTLPSLTGCAYLHISVEAADKDKYISYARRALSMFGSTSPSYLLLRSLDQTNACLAEGFRRELDACVRKVAACREQLRALGWKVSGGEPLKITIFAGQSGVSGISLADELRTRGIECEYADRDYVVLMPSPFNKEEDFGKLVAAMEQIVAGAGVQIAARPLMRPEKVITIRKAMFAASEEIPASLSEGRILADAALSCPPAVPILICGERIPEGAAETFAAYGIDKVIVTKGKYQ